MSDALEQRLRAATEPPNIPEWADAMALLREAAAELARLREALAQAERLADSRWLQVQASESTRRTDNTYLISRAETAEADLAACREERVRLIAELHALAEAAAKEENSD